VLWVTPLICVILQGIFSLSVLEVTSILWGMGDISSLSGLEDTSNLFGFEHTFSFIGSECSSSVVWLEYASSRSDLGDI